MFLFIGHNISKFKNPIFNLKKSGLKGLMVKEKQSLVSWAVYGCICSASDRKIEHQLETTVQRDHKIGCVNEEKHANGSFICLTFASSKRPHISDKDFYSYDSSSSHFGKSTQ